MFSAISRRVSQYRNSIDLRNDLGRTTRCVIAFLPVLLCANIPGVGYYYVYAGLSAQNIASYDVRGDYRLRIAVLITATLIFTAAAALGAAMGPSLFAAVIATAVVAMGAVLLRHLSPDYGPGTGMTAMVIFVIALSQPGNTLDHIWHIALWTLGGGLWGVIAQSAMWPFRPQHPLRRAVGESCAAAAELFNALKTDDTPPPASAKDNTTAPFVRQQRLAEQEAALRVALDKARFTLRNARNNRNTDFLERLENLSSLSGELATCVVSLHTTLLSAIHQESALAELEAGLQPILTSLTNTTRTAALAVVSREPSHLALAEVRVRRLGNLLVGYAEKVSTFAPHSATASDISVLIGMVNARATQFLFALRATIDRAAERAAFSLELLDTSAWTLKPFASVLNLGLKIDSVLLRFGARLTLLMVVGTILARLTGFPHAYWLVFTLILLLQPDYGSTRQRVVHRLVGTFFGSLVGSAFLWLPMPYALTFLLMAAAMFAFMLVIRRNYGLAVFFITIHVVMLTELNQIVTLQFTMERIVCTTLGGLLALVAALLFWPVWERSRIPGTLSAAIAANLAYWQNLFTLIHAGRPTDSTTASAARKADAANSDVFGSLKRMMGDPAHQREGLEESAAIANGNQRLTRVLNTIALRLIDERPAFSPQANIPDYGTLGGRALQTMSEAILNPAPESAARLTAARHEFTAVRLAPLLETVTDQHTLARARLIADQLVRAGTELNAMLLATETCLRDGVFDTSAQ